MSQSIEETKAYKRAYDDAHKNERREYEKKYHLANKEKERARNRAYYLAHRKEINTRNTAYRQRPENRTKSLIYHRKYRQKPESKIKMANYARRPEVKAKKAIYERRPEIKLKNKNRLRKFYMKKRYSLSVVDFEMIFEKQGKKCALCKTEKFNGQGPHIDHNHITGRVRGILCSSCNLALGLIKENIDTAERIVDYLKKDIVRDILKGDGDVQK